MKLIKMKLIAILLVILAIATSCAGISENTTTEVSNQSISNIPKNNLDQMQIHFIDVGQGDATLITCEGENMLIDAGDNDKGTYIQSYLQKNGVETLKYAIGTHPHADHIGGLDVIITKFNVEQVLIPEKETDTRTYDDVIQSMKYKNIQPTYPKIGDVYNLGSATFTILTPGANDYGNNLNNYSIAILLEHGDNRFIFTGDAEAIAEQDILNTGIDISADVYHVGHHGSKTSSDKSFVKSINPSSVVISCGENNEYGHPHAEPMNLFRSMGVEVYRTDEDGTIIASSDGNTISFDVPASDTWQVGEASRTKSDSVEIEDVEENSITVPDVGYVLNTNTKKFHIPTCSSVNKISDSNREGSELTRDDLISQGYSPCGICTP